MSGQSDSLALVDENVGCALRPANVEVSKLELHALSEETFDRASGARRQRHTQKTREISNVSKFGQRAAGLVERYSIERSV